MQSKTFDEEEQNAGLYIKAWIKGLDARSGYDRRLKVKVIF
jgi:hypothetical protein